ncbi:MAG: right-handed parallel beta-helix repeat-containing protein [Candidatus Thorarchaeota archaeon SMTZ1-45]
MQRKDGVCFVVLSLMFILVLGSVLTVADLEGSDLQPSVMVSDPEKGQLQVANTPHTSIVIDGDANFSATALLEGWPGDGSFENPYVIDKLDIDRGGGTGHCIYISNTRVNFTISNCILTGANLSTNAGIYLENVTYSKLIGNILYNNAFIIYLKDSHSVLIKNNTCTSNSLSIKLEASNSNTVVNNNCTGNSDGIYLNNSNSSTVMNNTLNSNDNYGIYLEYSYSNTVVNNTCTSSPLYGIVLMESNSNILANNTCANNDYGIYLYFSDLNVIQWNVLDQNGGSGWCSGTGNVFDYNYWSDYSGTDANGDGFGDAPHTFPGNSDPHPLMYLPYAPDWLHLPVDQVIEYGNIFEYRLEFIATALTAPYELSVDDHVNFAVGYDDTIISRIPLPVGVYPLWVVATNIYGYATEGTFMLTVEDTTPPLITSPEDITHTQGEGYYEIAWTMSDLSTISFRVLLDGTELTSGGVTTTSVYFTMTLEDKDPGVYNYTMVAEDIWGNIAIDTVIVMVLPIPFIEVMFPWMVGGAVIVISIVVIVFFLKRRKSS